MTVTTFYKKTRVINPELLERRRDQRCAACNRKPPSDPHHITTVKAGGGDLPHNVIPLCRVCHVKWHQEGAGSMIRKFKSVEKWLIDEGRVDILRRVKL